MSALADLAQRFDENVDQSHNEAKKLGKRMKFRSLMKQNVLASKKLIEAKRKPPSKRRLSAVALYLGFGVSLTNQMVKSEM